MNSLSVIKSRLEADSGAGQPVSNGLWVAALNFNSGLGLGDEFPGCHASETGSKPGRWGGPF
jgi:hypothetical protein